MGTGKRIGDECKRQGLTLRQLAIKADIPYSTLYSAVKRDSDGMTLELLKRISHALNMSLYSLADFDLASEAVTEEINANRRESQLLSHFRTLNDNGQTVAVERVQELTQIPAYQRRADTAQSVPGGADDKEPAEK